MRALLSAYDKTGIAAFARGLAELGWDLVASGGTARHLEDDGIRVTRVEGMTGFAEILGHRVVTLHPSVHGGILARRDVAADLADLEAHGIVPFDLVCVNLYPFEDAIGRLETSEAEAVEKIDVGGPAMLRGAAKNFAFVAAVCDPSDYEPILVELRQAGRVSDATRRGLARKAFAATAAYDGVIASYLSDGAFPETLVPAFDRVKELGYGENPHQRAAYYAQRGVRTHVLSHVDQLHGKPLSYNNLNDLSAARLLALELDGPGCVIVKHANPCGVAVATTVEEAYEKALAADPVSAYGGVVVFTHPVSAALGERLAEQFVEVLFAPGYDEAAVEVLTLKPSVRILNDLERRAFVPTERDFKRVLGGLLVQERDAARDLRATMSIACGSPGEEQWADLLFAWTVVKHVTSNAIVLAKDGQTLGIGAGQMSRVDAVRIAVEKALEHGHDLNGAVLASDAFFPFADGPQIALDAGIGTIVQPGGSKRDDEVTAAVAAARATMVLTGRRHFRH